MPSESKLLIRALVLPLLLVGLCACRQAEVSAPTAALAPMATLAPTATTIPPSPTAEPMDSERESGFVLDVIDGDTIDVAVDGEVMRVRYLGVNTPERGMPSYLVAKDLNRSLVYRQQVELERDVRDKDGYGRYLRHVYVGDTHVNLELLRSGWARLLIIPPNEKHSEALAAAQREAAEAQRGLWQRSTPPAGN